MGQVLHGSATTTHAIRALIQRSQASNAALSRELGINVKTVAKWRKRGQVEDTKMGPKVAHSTVLSAAEEAIIIAFRRHTLLPLDDCLYALQATVPHLTRSSLHRCLQRHDISRLPDMKGDKPAKKKFRKYPIGYIHIDIAEVRTDQGKLRLFVAIDRTSKFVYVELHERAGKMIAAQFLRNFIASLPYRIHTILTDNGVQFTNRKQDTTAFEHIFDRVCRENEIEHRLTKIAHPWTNGQVERMNRTLKEATVKRYHYDTHNQLKIHLSDFVNAYNYARRLKTLKGLTPFEYICKIWTSEPERFIVNQTQPITSWDYTPNQRRIFLGHYYEFKGLIPVVPEDAYVHPEAVLIGNVILGHGCYIGPGASLRGDFGCIEIGDGANVQDNCIVHSFPGRDAIVEQDGHIGHGAILHGCLIARNSLIGMNSVIMDGVELGENSIVGAQAFVKAGTIIPARSMVVGAPSRILRQVTDKEIEWKSKGTIQYQKLAIDCLNSMTKVAPLREIERDRKNAAKSDLAPLVEMKRTSE